MLDAQVKTFICAADHIDFHPQLPQILKSFDYSSAILKNSSRIDSEIIRWRGLDGTELDAVQRINFRWASPEAVLAADQRGHKSVVLGTPAFDAGTDLTSERESTLIDPIAPVFGTWVNAKELFERVPKPEQGAFLGVDELYAYNLAMWSGWGCMNESCALEPGLGEPVARGREAHGDCSGDRESLQRVLARIAGRTPYSMEEPAPFPRPHALWTGRLHPPGTAPARPRGGKGRSMVRCRRCRVWTASGPGNREERSSSIGLGMISRSMPLDGKVVGNGAMENYGETCAANYGGPMIPGSRYKRSLRCVTDSQKASGSVLNAMFRSLFGEDQRARGQDRWIDPRDRVQPDRLGEEGRRDAGA